MDVPECNELKAKYDTCFNEWYNSKKFSLFVQHPCQISFQVN